MELPATPRQIEMLLAEWVLERLPAERVPALAVAALDDEGCEVPTVAVLAGLMRPTRADVEDHLPQLLIELAKRRPSLGEALKVIVDLTARDIVAGQLDPLAGASRIWMLWGYSREGDDRSPAWADFQPFIGLASECDTPGPHVVEYKADIVREATALLERGGLRIAG